MSHTMPIACALARRGEAEIKAFTADAPTHALAAKIAADLGVSVGIEALKRPVVAERLLGPHRSKLPLLWRNRRRLAEYDAIVVPERTSLALQRMGVTQPRYVNLPHGAGDRAISVEPRYRRFDRILVAGPKTAERMAANEIDPRRIRQVGYPKAEYLASLPRTPIAGLDPGRPVIFFNPHFRRSLSSLDYAHEIVRALAAGSNANLIVAPHIRSFEGASPAELERWHSLIVPAEW